MNIEKEGSEGPGENLPRGATDMELAMFLIGHIDNPCQVEVEPGRMENIRGFYIKEAERVLGTITDESAKALLEFKIREHKE